jgi:hypothetical protein
MRYENMIDAINFDAANPHYPQDKRRNHRGGAAWIARHHLVRGKSVYQTKVPQDASSPAKLGPGPLRL